MISGNAVQLSGRDVRQFERLAQQYSMTFEEVIKLAAELIFAGFDPAPGDGEQLELSSPTLVGPDYFAKRNVPTPEDNVDIFNAQDCAQSDFKIGRYLLDTYPSRDTAIEVYANHLQWFRFWAVRSLYADERQQFAELVGVFEARLELLLRHLRGRA